MMRFLKSVQYLRDCRKADQAAITVVEAVLPDVAEELKSQLLRYPSQSTLVCARLRFDMTATLVRREAFTFEMESCTPTIRYLNADSSPKVGAELFGCIVHEFSFKVVSFGRRCFHPLVFRHDTPQYLS